MRSPLIITESELRLGNKADLLPCPNDERKFPITETISQSAESFNQLNPWSIGPGKHVEA